jgi:hypothetical protein
LAARLGVTGGWASGETIPAKLGPLQEASPIMGEPAILNAMDDGPSLLFSDNAGADIDRPNSEPLSCLHRLGAQNWRMTAARSSVHTGPIRA